ncbi:plasmid transfer protein TraB [Umezawaea beigongshangensis]|uniref:plasmid transfer protein TraB n=1 Tax=Umezawaea beigongshangensis TaxID=2780383 RepID=UPI0018F2701F|nr:plasmid transfer protein TraB [Umezawaea beigongshangensis]
MGKRNSDLAVTGGDTDKAMGYYVPRNYWGSRVAPYAGEWAAMVAAWPAGAVTHLYLADSPDLPWVTPGLTLLGAGLSALAYKAAGTRSAITRVHATATGLLATGWMTACAIEAPWTNPLAGLWLYGGAAVALSWNIRRALRGGEDNASGGLFEKVKLARVRTGEAQVAPNKVTVPLALPAGEVSIEDVQEKADKVAQVLGLHKGSVRITGDPDDLRRGTMAIVPNDVLRKPQPWPGPSAPGGSIMAPVVPGMYEDNEPERMFFPGNKTTQRQAATWIVIGMKGSGKTGGAKNCWTEILTRRDANLVVLDPSKGEQSVAFLGDSAHVITGQQACQRLVDRVPDTITGRADQLGKWGYDEWVPEAFTEHGMPYLVLWIEEATRVLEDAATLTRIAQECRSAGISLVLSLQKPSFRQMSTDVRSQIDGVLCFGVNDIADAGLILSDEVIDAGARPDRWKNRQVGCNYLEGPDVDEDRYAIPARTFTATDAQRTADINAHAGVRAAMDTLTAELLGLPAQPGNTTTTGEGKGSTVATKTSGARVKRADHSDLDRMPVPADDDPEPLPADADPDLHADPDMDLPEDPDMDLPGGRPTRKEALAMVCSAIEELAERGVTELTVRDLPDPKLLGRTRQWLSGILSGLAREGHLHEAGTDGNATLYRLPLCDAA